MKLNDADVEGLTGKSFKIIINYGKDGILQSQLWKELDLTSRDGSRVAIRLEKKSLIKREKILENGRWTYRLFAVKLPVGTQTIERAPCLTCPVEHMCSVDAYYSPNSCNLIENWILVSFDSATQQEEQLMKETLTEHRDDQIRNALNQAELLVSEPKSSMAKHQSNKLLKINKK
ncbi:MAG TPA: transcriptional regulator [Candidatus Nitrosopolaris sp.]|nr:transcriptional regulator [Candidatus Nitrosopolaris sp.]